MIADANLKAILLGDDQTNHSAFQLSTESPCICRMFDLILKHILYIFYFLPIDALQEPENQGIDGCADYYDPDYLQQPTRVPKKIIIDIINEAMRHFRINRTSIRTGKRPIAI